MDKPLNKRISLLNLGILGRFADNLKYRTMIGHFDFAYFSLLWLYKLMNDIGDFSMSIITAHPLHTGESNSLSCCSIAAEQHYSLRLLSEKIEYTDHY